MQLNAGHGANALGNNVDVDGVDHRDGDVANRRMLARLNDVNGHDIASRLEDGGRYWPKLASSVCISILAMTLLPPSLLVFMTASLAYRYSYDGLAFFVHDNFLAFSFE